MESANKEIQELKEKNDKLRRQFSALLDGYARLELTDLERKLQVSTQKRLIDFIQRISRRLDDDDLMDVLVEEFLIELGADRVSFILPGGGPMRRLAVANEAVEPEVSRLALPYFISSRSDERFLDLLYHSLDRNDLAAEHWKASIEIIPESAWDNSMIRHFQAAMEEEFNVAPAVHCRAAMAFPIRTTIGGDSILCLQRIRSDRGWSNPQKGLFRDMCRYTGMLLDQTQLTQQIRDLKDQLSSLIQSMPSAIIGMDLLGTVTMWGGRAAEMFGIREETAMGRVFWKLIPDYHFVSNAIMDVMKLDGTGGMEFEDFPYKRKDGQVVYHHATLFTMFGSNRGEVALRIDDVTNHVELNHQLFHAQRMETVGTLAGGLAHDFNNVLGGIVGTLSLLKKRVTARREAWDTGSVDDELEDIEILEACTVRASEMVQRLLSLSKKSVIHMEPVNMNQVVKNVVALCKASFNRDIRVEFDLPRSSKWILGDETQLEQVLLNLCLNARDAMLEGGVLSLRLSEYRVTETFRKKHSSCRERRLVRVAVRDTGEGIPLRDLDKIFDPFFTTKSEQQGTGLGLSIVDKIVKEHNGYIEVESQVGRGTAFTLYFVGSRLGRAAQRNRKLPVRGSGDILVVDDDEIMRKTISRILYGLGYSVATAAGGEAAVRLCGRSVKFDLIVLDVEMPGMDGLEAARVLRAGDPSTRILFCTGRQHQYQVQDALSQPNTWLITKPFSLDELGKTVKSAMPGADGSP